MQVEIKAQIAVAGVFLHDNLLETEVVDAKAAILFLGPGAEQAIGPGFRKSLAVNNASLLPAFDIRPNFGLHEFANRVPELFMLKFESYAAH